MNLFYLFPRPFWSEMWRLHLGRLRRIGWIVLLALVVYQGVGMLANLGLRHHQRTQSWIDLAFARWLPGMAMMSQASEVYLGLWPLRLYASWHHATVRRVGGDAGPMAGAQQIRVEFSLWNALVEGQWIPASLKLEQAWVNDDGLALMQKNTTKTSAESSSEKASFTDAEGLARMRGHVVRVMDWLGRQEVDDWVCQDCWIESENKARRMFFPMLRGQVRASANAIDRHVAMTYRLASMASTIPDRLALDWRRDRVSQRDDVTLSVGLSAVNREVLESWGVRLPWEWTQKNGEVDARLVWEDVRANSDVIPRLVLEHGQFRHIDFSMAWLGWDSRWHVRYADIAGRVSPEAATVTSLVARMEDGTHLSLSLHYPFSSKSAQAFGGITAEGLLHRARFDDLGQYWPPGLAPLPRRWVLEHVPHGTVEEGAFRVKLPYPLDPKNFPPPRESIAIRLPLREVLLDYAEGFPPVRIAKAEGVFDGHGITIAVEEATVAKSSKIIKGSVWIPYLRHPSNDVSVDTTVRGPLADILEFVPEVARRSIAHPRANWSEIGGIGETECHLVIPLKAKDWTSVLWDIRGRATSEVTLPASWVGGSAAVIQSLLYGWNGDMLWGEGRGRLADRSWHWSVVHHLPPVHVGALHWSGPLDPALLDHWLTPDLWRSRHFSLAGLMDGQYHWRWMPEHQRHHLSGQANGKDSAWGIPAFRVVKPAGVESSVEAEAVIDSDRVQIKGWNVKSPVWRSRGKAVWSSKEKRWQSIAMPLWESEKHRFHCALDRMSGRMRWTLGGELFDLTAWLDHERQFASPPSAPLPTQAVGLTKHAEWVEGKVRLGTLQGYQSTILHDVEGAWRCPTDAWDRCEMMQWTARTSHPVESRSARSRAMPMGQQPFRQEHHRLALETEGSKRRWVMTSDRVSDLLRMVSDTKAMDRGKARVVMEQVLDGTYEGSLVVDNFSMRQSSWLVRLLSLSSIGGWLSMLSSGIGFDQATATLVYVPDRHVLLIRDGVGDGQAMHWILDGSIVFSPLVRFDLQGTLIPPIFGLNRTLAKIPVLGVLLAGNQEGGGLLGTTFSIRGTPEDPRISGNPLSALTPGILRQLFRKPLKEETPSEALKHGGLAR